LKHNAVASSVYIESCKLLVLGFAGFVVALTTSHFIDDESTRSTGQHYIGDCEVHCDVETINRPTLASGTINQLLITVIDYYNNRLQMSND